MDTLRRYRWLILAGLAIAVVIAVASAWLASNEPDGLNRVAESQGFSDQARDSGFEILPGYHVPGISGDASKVIARVIGVAVVAALTLGAGYLLRRRDRPTPPPPGDRGS